MRNKHIITADIECKCPFDGCGKTFYKKIKIIYILLNREEIR